MELLDALHFAQLEPRQMLRHAPSRRLLGHLAGIQHIIVDCCAVVPRLAFVRQVVVAENPVSRQDCAVPVHPVRRTANVSERIAERFQRRQVTLVPSQAGPSWVT